MTRREILGSTLSAVASTVASTVAIAARTMSADPPARTTLGVTIDCYQFGRRRQPALEFAQYCDSLGAGGIQIEIPSDLVYSRALRTFLESRGMFLDVMVSLPNDDTSAFESQVEAAREAGAFALRAACLGGRRYEVFKTPGQWRDFVRDSHRKIARALRIAEKYRIPLCLENHKDWTVDELAAILKQYSSEYLGLCLDTGNNLSLLDDYRELVERLAPYTVNTHLKDMSLAEYRDGLLLVEPLLGGGFFDLPWIVSTIRNARPDARFTVEMLTRDPLKVPVFADPYWVTFPDRNGRYLARAVATARAHGWAGALPAVERTDRETRLRLEDDNVVQCLNYAREKLGMGASHV
jgi:sugar phosphate isomerase/epimerase